MSWTTPRELKDQLTRHWNRGTLLRPLVTGEASLPLRLALRCPSSAELTERFEAVRGWAAELAAVPHLRIVPREVRHRVHGMQRLPDQAWVDTLDDALALLGRRREAERLARVVEQTRVCCAPLLPWLAKHPLQAIDLAEHWPHLLAVVRWCVAHPRSRLYLRQIDVPGVHSKFIEAHRAVLSELLDLALPSDAIRGDRVGVGQFAARFGFRDKPVRIRFRVLDRSIPLLPGIAQPDITLDEESFANLDFAVGRAFVTENETNFLAFPSVPGAIAIFGGGYGWNALGRARWLEHCEVHYWGDIDTHGFRILDQLRGSFAHAKSFLMDRATLTAHEAFWGEEVDQVRHDLGRLNEEERTLFDDLRRNHIRIGLRLEQERVGFRWLEEALTRV